MAESFIEILDHADRAKSAMLSQFADSTNLKVIVDSLAAQLQELETTIQDVLSKRMNIDLADGVTLDQIGSIVGRKRNGFSDADYRDLLRLQIAINNSKGNPEPISSTIKNITGSSFIQTQEQFPAGVDFIVGDSNINPDLLPLIEEVASAGVNVNIYAINSFDDDVFAFEGYPEDIYALGFGDVDDPLLGGKFSSLVNV
jgi:uncharacterized phage protein gp47/JayE